MRIKEGKWHQAIKHILMEMGEKKSYDVSESENEMYFTEKFSMFEGEKREKHTLTYKPDVVWKRGIRYQAIFEIEYLSPSGQTVEKRKYALGTFLLSLIASHRKGCGKFVVVSNNERLLREIITSWMIIDFLREDSEVEVCFISLDPSEDNRFKDPVYLKKHVEKCVTEDFSL